MTSSGTSTKPPWLGSFPRSRFVGLILIAFAIFFMIPGFIWQRCGWRGCPNVDRLQSYQPGKESKLVDRNGTGFAVLRPVEGETTPLERVPEHVRSAFIAIEDKRFFSHAGVDWRRVVGAILANLKSGTMDQGFSTITMQLARNVFPDRLPAKERTFQRKLLEIRVAADIEDRFSKDEILELYLSHIYFGNGARGISAAANHYYGKRVEQLTLSEGAMLAALLKGPALYDPRRHPESAKRRRNLVLDQMATFGKASPTEVASAKNESLNVIRKHAPVDEAPDVLGTYFAEEVRRQLEDEFGEQLFEETCTIITTLDAQMQRAAEEELGRQIAGIESGGLGAFSPGDAPLQGAIVALQSHTGDVLAWVGGNDFGASRFDRVKNARRQTGSAFKPFVYAAALNEGHVLSEYLQDQPVRIELQSGKYWEPKNFDDETEGRVTMRDALVRSRNIPTVNLGKETGLSEIKSLAEDAGIESEIETTPALPLGTPAVSPLELAAAYTPFATLGKAVKPRLILRVLDSKGDEIWAAGEPEAEEVLDDGVAYLITNVLQEALDAGTGAIVRKLGFRDPAAGKTGTTNGGTDAWFVGYTPEVVAVVWIGFDQPRTIMEAATGGRLAAPVWARFMQRSLFVQSAARNWIVPEEIIEGWVDPTDGKLIQDGCSPIRRQAYRELFVRDNTGDSVCPQRGEILAMQPRQRPSDEEDARDFQLFPEELFGRSQPAPGKELEEAEPQKKQKHKMDKGRSALKKIFDRIRHGGKEKSSNKKGKKSS